MHNYSRMGDQDVAVIQTLLHRLNTLRLPRAFKLKEQVDGGEQLSAQDLLFLKRALTESGEARRLAAKYPQYQSIVVGMTSLYAEIVHKGIANERDTKKSVNQQS